MSLLHRLRAQWPLWLLVAAVLLHLAMMASLFWGYLDSWFYAADRVPQALDFFSIYEAGHSVLEGRSMYRFNFFSGFAEAKAPYFSPYRYVPIFAYGPGVLFNALPPWRAYWGWVAFNELLLVANAYVTWRIAGKSVWGVVGAAMWFAFSPYYLEMYQGQFSFVMATTLLYTAIGLMHSRELLAGVSWAISLVTKSTTLILTPLLLRMGWWRALLAGAALAAVNIPYFLWRPGDFEFFVRASVNDSVDKPLYREFLYTPADHGLLAFFQNTALSFKPDATNVPSVLPVSLTLAVVFASLTVTFLGRRADRLLLFATWASAFFLFGGWVPEYHYVMLLPVLVLLVGHRPAFRLPALAVFVALALPTPYWLLNHVWNSDPVPAPFVLDPLQEAWPAWGVIFYHAVKPVATLALWAYLVAVQWREGIELERVPQLWSTVQGRLRLRMGE